MLGKNIRRVTIGLLISACAFVAGLIWQSNHAQPSPAPPLVNPTNRGPSVPIVKQDFLLPRHQAQAVSHSVASNFRVLNDPDVAPAWVVKYGEEFWRGQTRGGDDGERAIHALETDRGTGLPEITAVNYTARFDGQGLQFSPSRLAQSAQVIGAPAADPETEMFFRTASIQRNGEAYFSAEQNTTQWSFIGNTAQGLLSMPWGMSEHYEAANNGVEVTWVFQQPLPARGPVEIAAMVGGLTYAGTTDQGEHFADISGVARVRVGQAFAVDHMGNRWELATHPDSNGKLIIDLPDGIQEEAVYPLAVDPVISSEFGVDKAASASTYIHLTDGASLQTNLTVQFSAPTYSVSESAGGFAMITVTVDGKYSGEFTVDFATADGTAAAGTDYMRVVDRLVFSDKKTSATALVPIIGSGRAGTNKTVNLTLQHPMGGVLLGGQATATLTILE